MKGYPFSLSRTVLTLAGACLALAACLPAQAQIWRCQDADGIAEYSNTRPADGRRNCERVELPALTTVPATPATSAKRATSRKDFPKVDPATQRARDTERRQILEAELSKEEERLAELEAEYKDGEPDRLGSERNYQKYLDRVERLKNDISRSQASLASIRRELDALPR